MNVGAGDNAHKPEIPRLDAAIAPDGVWTACPLLPHAAGGQPAPRLCQSTHGSPPTPAPPRPYPRVRTRCPHPCPQSVAVIHRHTPVIHIRGDSCDTLAGEHRFASGELNARTKENTHENPDLCR